MSNEREKFVDLLKPADPWRNDSLVRTNPVVLWFTWDDSAFDRILKWFDTRFLPTNRRKTWDVNIGIAQESFTITAYFVNVEDSVETCLIWSQYCEC